MPGAQSYTAIREQRPKDIEKFIIWSASSCYFRECLSNRYQEMRNSRAFPDVKNIALVI